MDITILAIAFLLGLVLGMLIMAANLRPHSVYP